MAYVMSIVAGLNIYKFICLRKFVNVLGLTFFMQLLMTGKCVPTKKKKTCKNI